MDDRPYPYPNWKRVGFTLPPDPKTSGRGIGVLILDTLRVFSKASWLSPTGTNG